AVDFAVQHAQHRHLLTAMMRSVGNAPDQNPPSAANDLEEAGLLLEPHLWLMTHELETLARIGRVAADGAGTVLGRWKRRGSNIDTQHRPKPQVLAHALVNHLLADAAASAIGLMRTHGQVLVLEHAPDAYDLHDFRLVGVNEELVSHRPSLDPAPRRSLRSSAAAIASPLIRRPEKLQDSPPLANAHGANSVVA